MQTNIIKINTKLKKIAIKRVVFKRTNSPKRSYTISRGDKSHIFSGSAENHANENGEKTAMIRGLLMKL